MPDTVGLESHKPTSLRGITMWVLACKWVALVAKVSTTKEPDVGKLHVRVCAGAPGNRGFYREIFQGELSGRAY